MAVKSVAARPVARQANRGQLSRERIVGAAIRLADDAGLAGLSMRKLAQELGVEAMSLYHHLPNRDALLTAMMDAVYAEMELPPDTADWRADIRHCSVSARDAMMRHTWSADLITQPMLPSLARLAWMEAVLGRLRRAGFSPNLTHHAYHALDSHVTGFVLWVLPYVRMTQEMPGMAAQFLEALDAEKLPYLAEHVQQHAGDRQGDTSEFEFGLGLILDGLERLRDQAGGDYPMDPGNQEVIS